jgi:outer membrane receptor protein involved in Fe transport
LQLKTNVNYAWDNFALSSVKGTTMGGTRENRADLSTMLIANDLIAGNRLAVGVQYRRFGFGRNNFQGNNFIVNVIDSLAMASPSAFIKKANMEKTLGYERDINVVSVFAEDYQKINEKIDVFAAFRYDNHPFWGSNISPRLGAIISPTEKIRFRLSYQKGFRGAVGLHYGGGYKQDGFLQADNYSQVAAAQITTYNSAGAPNGIEPNISKVKPEIMNSIELAAYYKFNDRLSFEAVGFYNTIQNVIDVGVIYRDRSQMNVPNIGSDVPGDWNGYWYFKNTDGSIKQYGTEAALRYGGDKINISLSHSLVKLASSSEQQRGSMYLSKGNNFKAYPENVTRLNVIVTPIDRFSLGINYMYYYSWYSPSDQKVDGNHLLNLTGMVDVNKNIQASFTVRNVLAQSKLYPMNSNVGGPDLSDGTPSVESPSFIFRVGYKF